MTAHTCAPDPSMNFIVEFQTVGNAVKVSAIDPATLTEVSIAAPADAGETLLKRLAVRKLLYVLRRRALPADGRCTP